MTKSKDQRRENISVATEVRRRHTGLMFSSQNSCLSWLVIDRIVSADRPAGGAQDALPGPPGEGGVPQQEGQAVGQGEVQWLLRGTLWWLDLAARSDRSRCSVMLPCRQELEDEMAIMTERVRKLGTSTSSKAPASHWNEWMNGLSVKAFTSSGLAT